MLFDDPVINIRLAIDYKRSQCLECYMRAIARSKQKKVGVKKKEKKIFIQTGNGSEKFIPLKLFAILIIWEKINIASSSKKVIKITIFFLIYNKLYSKILWSILMYLVIFHKSIIYLNRKCTLKANM